MTLTIRRPGLLVVVVAISALAVGAFLTFQSLDRGTPAYHLTLIGTTWTVASIEHSPEQQDRQTITFNQIGTVDVSTGCGHFKAGWDLDGDGDAIGFSDVPPTPAICRPEISDQDDALRRALAGTRSWIYLDDNHIELHGADLVELVRP